MLAMAELSIMSAVLLAQAQVVRRFWKPLPFRLPCPGRLRIGPPDMFLKFWKTLKEMKKRWKNNLFPEFCILKGCEMKISGGIRVK
jgi:histidinol phosphatase-like PHP family hydrolase